MYNDLWKKIIIALTAFIGIQIVLVIIPGFVILLTTPNIINVNTESQWINYLKKFMYAMKIWLSV